MGKGMDWQRPFLEWVRQSHGEKVQELCRAKLTASACSYEDRYELLFDVLSEGTRGAVMELGGVTFTE